MYRLVWPPLPSKDETNRKGQATRKHKQTKTRTQAKQHTNTRITQVKHKENKQQTQAQQNKTQTRNWVTFNRGGSYRLRTNPRIGRGNSQFFGKQTRKRLEYQQYVFTFSSFLHGFPKISVQTAGPHMLSGYLLTTGRQLGKANRATGKVTQP